MAASGCLRGGDANTPPWAHGGMISSAVRLFVLYKRGLPDSIREFVSNDEIARAYRCWSGITEVAQPIALMAIAADRRQARVRTSRCDLHPWSYRRLVHATNQSRRMWQRIKRNRLKSENTQRRLGFDCAQIGQNSAIRGINWPMILEKSSHHSLPNGL
jgi:hypothetical protein